MGQYIKKIYLDNIKEIDSQLSTMTTSTYEGLNYRAPDLTINFSDNPSTEIITEIETILGTYFEGTLLARSIVENAMEFGNEMILNFASENVLMGITQAGKTKDVADYLQNVDRYMRSGSLYEVINEINSLITAGVPVDLAPFITEDRLNQFITEINEYLAD